MVVFTVTVYTLEFKLKNNMVCEFKNELRPHPLVRLTQLIEVRHEISCWRFEIIGHFVAYIQYEPVVYFINNTTLTVYFITFIKMFLFL